MPLVESVRSGMKPYRLVIFDLDGTLLDTSEGLLRAFRKTLTANGLPVISDDSLRTAIGPPFYRYLFETYPELSEQDALRLTDEFRKIYVEDGDLFRASLYPDILRLWETLSKRGVTLAVATNKRQDQAVSLLSHFGFDHYSAHLYGTDVEKTMRKADVIRHCLSATGISRELTVMVGDTEDDAIGAGSAGIDFIGVCYGFGFRTADDVMRCKNARASAGQPMDILDNIFIRSEKDECN